MSISPRSPRPEILPSEWLATHEWIQGRVLSYDLCGRKVGGCLVGAMIATLDDEMQYVEFYIFVNGELQKDHKIDDDFTIAHYNDHVLKTKDEAVRTLQYYEQQYFAEQEKAHGR